MIFYRVLFEASATVRDYSHHATLADAHHAAQGYPKDQRECVLVEQFEVRSDKGGILELLQGYDPFSDLPAAKRWELSARGGLREIAIELAAQ